MSSPMEVDPRSDGSPPNPCKPYEHATKFNSDIQLLIEKERSEEESTAFARPILSSEDAVTLLHILLKASYPDCTMDRAACKTYLGKRSALPLALNWAYFDREFADVMTNDEMPSLDLIRGHSPNTGSGLSQSNSGSSFHSVFKQPYRGDTARLFIDTLNKEREAYSKESGLDTPYNWSISVVQSSGMGKSRMVEEAGNIVFTIPINLREEMVKTNLAYPPEDKNMRQFFLERQDKSDEVQQAEYANLLTALFATAKNLVRANFPGKKGSELARAWAEYLNEGQNDTSVGHNRKQFYDDVIEAAKTLTTKSLEGPLKISCEELLDLVHPDRPIDHNACVVYFDEAHTLTETEQSTAGSLEQNPFHNLGTVLTGLVKCDLFFVFLSTNSCLSRLAQTAKTYPSDRVTQGSQLIPPFTELPFDVYEEEVSTNLHNMTIRTAGKATTMINFGRPLWYAQCQARPQEDIFDFALKKLSRSSDANYKSNSALAALGVRVGITFDETTTYSVQSDLVESHLRIVYSIPRHRAFMHTGASSEPVVAEAAGRYFDTKEQEGLPVEGPKLLFEASKMGFLARGERGELAGRLLLTSAHDIALKKTNLKLSRTLNQPVYHRPIPVLEFLDALFHESHHRMIHEAKCVTGRGSGSTLREAFSCSYIFFSHFALAKDSAMLSQFGLASALVRGMALQAKDGQESIDAVIPIHMASLDTPISPATTSAINLQFKNRINTPDCHVNRSITVSNLEMPVISIIFELGIKGKKANSIEIKTKIPPSRDTRARPTHRDDYHYEIVTRGCSPAIFGAISSRAEWQYEGILGAGTILHDFPRWDSPRNVDALEALKPAFSGKGQQKIYKAWAPKTGESRTGSVKPDLRPTDSGSADQEFCE